MGSGFEFRDGTTDESIFLSITEYNEYELPDRLPADSVIVDIGTHIGSFCHAVLSRGAERVYGFEADPENFARAERNLARQDDRLVLKHAAVWRSDVEASHLTLCDCPEPANTGWREVFGNSTGVKVPAVPFDDVIRDVTDWGRKRVRILKIDCEGSEFPILLTSRVLHLVDSIVGEFHEFNTVNFSAPIPEAARVGNHQRYSMAELTPVLERWGFQVRTKPYPNTRLGLFWGDRVAISQCPARPHFLRRLHGLVRFSQVK